ncbi:type 1 glutamine amidotransferase domain-containing protein [Marispirochaeta sp.]|jgi:protease I|uniref:type 1 glutamine amidotransferase domain-containing protein n=1 Tax=Marispirochaeta sp. TaxID=2038653 RepID=UPI0029C891D2|nr:type 1 glutamine amidotransferase domain-containing protein [Marispirochaeta sp.]
MKKIIAFIDEQFEDLELWYPVLRCREAGFQVDIAGKEAGKTYHGKYGVPASSEVSFQDLQASDYDGLLVPGGWAPDKLRRYDDVLRITREIFQAGKPVGHICHAGWVLASADIVKGYTMTSTPGIKDDLIHAGAEWVDKSAVTDRNIVSARKPADLPDYMAAYLKLF